MESNKDLVKGCNSSGQKTSSDDGTTTKTSNSASTNSFSIMDLLKIKKPNNETTEDKKKQENNISTRTDTMTGVPGINHSNVQLQQQNILLQNMLQVMIQKSSTNSNPFLQKPTFNVSNSIMSGSLMGPTPTILQQLTTNSSSSNSLTVPVLNQPTNVTFTGLGGATANMFNPSSTNLSLIARRRKARTVFSDAQLNGLESRFLSQRYLSTKSETYSEIF